MHPLHNNMVLPLPRDERALGSMGPNVIERL